MSFSFLFGSLLLPSLLLNKFRSKTILSLATLLYIPFTASNFYPATYLIYPSAFLVGTAGSLVWSSSRVYITKISIRQAKVERKNAKELNSYYSGIMYAFYSFSLVIGSIVAIFTTSTNDATDSACDFNVTLANNSVCNSTVSSTQTCGLYYDPPNFRKSPQSEKISLGKTLPIFLVLQGLSSVLYFLLSEPGSPSKDRAIDGTKVELFKLIFKTVKEDKAASLAVLLVIKGGLMRAFILGKFTSAWVSCSIGVTHVARCLVVFGLLKAVGSFLSGQAAKKVSLSKILLFNTAAENLIILFLFLWKVPPENDQTAILYVTTAALGFGRGVFESQVPSCYSFMWPEGSRVAASSALYFASRATGSCIMFFLDGVLYPVAQLVVLVVSLNVGALLMVVALKIRDKDSRYSKEDASKSVHASVLL